MVKPIVQPFSMQRVMDKFQTTGSSEPSISDLRKEITELKGEIKGLGFTEMIKHWWDNYVPENEKDLVYNATTTAQVVRVVDGQETIVEEAQEDACATLLYYIARHFVGEPKLFQDRSLEILNNLRCKNLADFRWYKDTFLVKVLIRPDCNNDFWKERFISGLLAV